MEEVGGVGELLFLLLSSVAPVCVNQVSNIMTGIVGPEMEQKCGGNIRGHCIVQGLLLPLSGVAGWGGLGVCCVVCLHVSKECASLWEVLGGTTCLCGP